MKLRSYAPIALILLLGFVTLVWFGGNFVLNNADSSYPVTPIKDFHQSLYGWWDRGVGQGNLRALAWSVIYNGIIAILDFIGFSVSSGQKIIMCLLFVASGISMYIFMHKFVLKNIKYSRPASFVSSVFYMMNLYNLQFLWGLMLLSPLFTYSFLPLILYMLDKSFKNKKYLCVLALLFFLISPTGNNPSYYLPLVLGFGFFFFWYLFFSPKSERKSPALIISHFLKILAIFFLVNSFWLIPIIFNLAKEYSQILSIKPLAFSSFAEMFRLLGWWSFNGSHKGYLYFPYSYVYDTPFFILIGFAITIVSLANLLKKKPLRLSIFFALAAIISLFFEKGACEPFALINKWFYDNVPGFMAFRNPYKFGNFFVFSMAGLLGISLTSIAKYLDKKRNPPFVFLFFLSSFLIINIYAWPFWTGDIYPEYKNSILKSSRIKIPQYYQDILAYTSSEKEDFKILGLPVLETVPSGWIPFKWGHYGEDPLYHFLDKSYILPTPYDNKYLIRQLFASLYKENNINLIQQISSFLNLKYVIWRNDVDCDFLSANTFCQNLENSIYHSSALNFKSSFGQLDIYEINKDFLPHFYIPQNIVYSPNEIEILPDILSMDDYEIRSAVYLQKEEKLRNSLAPLAEIEKLENRADEIFVKGENKKDIEKILNQVQDDGEGEIFYPYVKHEPGSLKWEAALLKEKYDKWQARKEPEKLIEKHLFYANKRINELKEFYADNADIKDADNADKENADKADRKNTDNADKKADKADEKRITLIEMWEKDLEEAIVLLEKIQEEEKRTEWAIKIKRNIKDNKEKLGNSLASLAEIEKLEEKEKEEQKLGNSSRQGGTEIEKLEDKEKEQKLGNSLALLAEIEKLEEKLDEYIPKLDIGKREYEVEIPRAGNYSLLIKGIGNEEKLGNSLASLAEIERLEIDGEKIADNALNADNADREDTDNTDIGADKADRKTDNADGGWREWGEINLEEGKHILTLKFGEIQNLLKYAPVGRNMVAFGDRNSVATQPEIKKLEIDEWQEDQWYQVKGKYEIENGEARLIIEERKEKEEEKLGNSLASLAEIEKLEKFEISKEIILTAEDEEFEFFIKADPKALAAQISLVPSGETKIILEDLRVEPVWEPEIFLRSKNADNADIKNADNADRKDADNTDIGADKADEKTRIPKITFVKINPTKYRIKVEGAKEPYTLVFSESFHEGWRLYADNADKENTDKADEEDADNTDYGEIVASYFDGQIKEGTHRNTFLEPATFETWGKEPIAQDNHLLVNGYANSWYITPNDVDGAENYELIVEFWPQRLFYIGLFISGLTLVGCLGYLTISRITRIKRTKKRG